MLPPLPGPCPHSMSSTGASLDDEALFRMAREEIEHGHHEAALGRLLALRARLAAPNASLEMELGMLYQRMGRNAEALQALESALALKPESGVAHKNYAALLAAEGRMQEARAALRRAVAAIPADAGLWLRLAAAETYLGDSATSLACLGRAVESMPASAA